MNAPEPSDETGLNTHFGSTFAARPASDTPPSHELPKTATNPFRNNSVSKKDYAYTTTRELPSTSNQSQSPSHNLPNYREEAFGGEDYAPRKTPDGSHLPANEGRPRAGSLTERFPGDKSHQPLDMIRRSSKKANRSPHLNKRHMPGADAIDRLDPTIGSAYHHEGPYDAALLARNTDVKHSPIAALKESNEEALRATPRENIRDAVERHRPLDGTAIVPPGHRDSLGRKYDYEEGTDMMREGNPPGGAYKQWPGEKMHTLKRRVKVYDKDDLTGQSEPSYSLDRALQNHTIHERDFDGHHGIELSERAMMSDNTKGHHPSLDQSADGVYNTHHYAATTGRDSKTMDTRDPIEIAGDDGKYADMQHAMDPEAHQVKRNHSIKAGIKKGLG
ncbi:hypothetical protein LTR28_001500, partial [Elasticomyces elasticus]